MKLINEAKRMQQLAGLLKENETVNEYITASPETVQEAFTKAGIDMSKPVTVVEVSGHTDDEPYETNPVKLAAKLQNIKDQADKSEGVRFDYEASEAFSPEEYGLPGMQVKLSVMVSDAYEYAIFQ